MAAMTSAIIAGAALAYGVYNGEETKKQFRSAEDDTNKENSRIRVEAESAQALSEETETQQRARARQKGLGPAKNGAASFVPAPGATVAAPIASTNKTLLGS